MRLSELQCSYERVDSAMELIRKRVKKYLEEENESLTNAGSSGTVAASMSALGTVYVSDGLREQEGGDVVRATGPSGIGSDDQAMTHDAASDDDDAESVHSEDSYDKAIKAATDN